MNQVREAIRLVDQLEQLGKADELTPQRFERIMLRVVAACADLVAWTAQAQGRTDALRAAGAIDQVATLLIRLQVMHGSDLLEPPMFEATIERIRALLTEVDDWADRARPRRTIEGRPDNFDLAPGVLQAPRKRRPGFIAGVVEGGRA